MVSQNQFTDVMFKFKLKLHVPQFFPPEAEPRFFLTARLLQSVADPTRKLP